MGLPVKPKYIPLKVHGPLGELCFFNTPPEKLGLRADGSSATFVSGLSATGSVLKMRMPFWGLGFRV